MKPRRWYFRFFPLLGIGGVLVTGSSAGWLTDLGVKRLLVPRQYGTEAWMDQITDNPETSGFRLQRFSVTSADSFELKAMVLEPAGSAGTTKRGQVIRAALKDAGVPVRNNKVRGTLILLHGFNARKEHMLPFAGRMTAAGFRCVIYDSRGHGDSGGTYATFGAREKDDLRRVVEAARTVVGGQGLGPLGLLGYSMGGAVAIQSQPEMPEVKAVASIAAFAEFREVILGQAAGAWRGLGTPLLPLVRWETRWRAGFDPWDIRPLEAAKHLTCPLFLAHGTADALVPASEMQRLASAAGAQVRELLEIKDATHGNVFVTGGDALWSKLAVFFVRELAADPSFP